ncbi:hypothetical protein BKA82DRAFT_29649 [Pisolithus tinctorius]|nr:hypothetical protein BKA82DRAFT_29649 [Pisolithus tinctorius]
MASEVLKKGHPPVKVVADNLHPLERVDNKSNQWYHECKHCGPTGADDDYLTGPELITDDDVAEAFDDLEPQRVEAVMAGDLPAYEGLKQQVLQGMVYSWEELEHVEMGLPPTGFHVDVSAIQQASGSTVGWDIDSMMSSEGLTSQGFQ